MPTIVSATLRSATRRDEVPLNILSFPTHERYQTSLAQTCHNFYLFRSEGLKEWKTEYAPLPPNYILLKHDHLPHDIVFDVILTQSKADQFHIGREISKKLQVPQINLEHTLPLPNWGRGKLLSLRSLVADTNVFIGDYSRNAWLWGEATVIEHGVDTELFRPPPPEVYRHPLVLSVVNDWINRDVFCGFKFWKEATEGIPCVTVGATPGFSLPAKDVDELVQRYQTSQIFVNTSLISPVPTSLLEAMSCGCAVVSTNTCMIPDIIINGYNGRLASTPSEMKKILFDLLKSPEECKRLGEGARQTILRRFNLEQFVDRWNKVFYETKLNLLWK